MLIMNDKDVQELEIEMTTLCNAQCPLCYRNYKSFPVEYQKPYIRPFSDLVSQLDKYCSLNYVMIVGSMSEPTLYPNFIQLVKYLKSRQIKVEVCTNGDTHSKQFWIDFAETLDEKIDKVYFTICGSTQELHERYRRGTSLANILENAKAFRSVCKADYAQCIRFNYNTDDFDTREFKHLVSQFSNVYMTETFFPKHLDEYKIKFNIDDFLPNYHKIDDYKKAVKLASDVQHMKSIGYIKCKSLDFKRQQIDPFGNVYPCYLHLEYSNNHRWSNDYTSILAGEVDCCKFCQCVVQQYCKKKNIEYIV